MARERISSNVPRETVLRIIEAAKRLSVSISRYIEIAVEAELDKLDSRAEIERLKKEQKHLVDQRDVARIQRDVACESIKTIATQLGATNDVADCKQQISKLQAEATEARRQRDLFKARGEEAQTKLDAAESKIKALQSRGLFARAFNRAPKI